ncbi:universal stress protein [Thermodesulfobacteriota bacterium]
MVEITKVLFPSDMRENSFKTLPYVPSFSEKFNSMLYLLHVVEDLHKLGGMYIPHIPIKLYQKEAEAAAEKVMDQYCKKLASRGQILTDFQRKMVSGDPATEILKAVDSEGIDLLIMGTHGYKGLEHTVLGSVAENVVKRSPVPVLVINPYKVK